MKPSFMNAPLFAGFISAGPCPFQGTLKVPLQKKGSTVPIPEALIGTLASC